MLVPEEMTQQGHAPRPNPATHFQIIYLRIWTRRSPRKALLKTWMDRCTCLPSRRWPAVF